jgi:hypothetical protein
MTRAALLRKLAAELRAMGSMFEVPNDFAMRCRIILTPEQMGANLRRLDRAAFALDKYADIAAVEDSPGPVQNDEQRKERSDRRLKPMVTAEMKLAADFLDSILNSGDPYVAKENGPETGAV